ncbi:hypothetical protein QEZ54_20625 [Catellatospora sp. KI3]|uniref:hypothetical protein n=1 Tax=Catellatospora sp. KI3 TaxID=3041620 RepID=UPI002482F07F|nr:hypothetical protein [Catellatospora sp. KI3]MDI1463389.1 hypothetical protein [Catellatospora sp. KI3]
MTVAGQTSRTSDSHIGKVVDRVLDSLPDPARWQNPGGYPDGLALCTIDAVQSIGVRYGSVVTVLDRYRTFRRAQGAEPAVDGAAELLRTFADVGGVNPWAAAIGNAHRTSTTPGAPLKAEAVEQAATVLLAARLPTCHALRQGADDQLHVAKQAWLRVPGQRSGISWRYLLMLAGRPGVKPDRMIIRFVAAALGCPVGAVTPDQAADLVEQAAGRLNVTSTHLDHAIWRWQSGRDLGTGAQVDR